MFLTEQLANTINNIIEIVLNNNGIIWGSYIQNMILNKHYSNIFYDLNLSYENYWDTNYNIETLDRIIVDDVIYIHFNDINDLDNTFIMMNKINYNKYEFSYDIRVENKFDIIFTVNSFELPPYKKALFLSHCLIMYKNLYTNEKIIELSDNTGLNYDYIPKKDKIIIKDNIIKEIYNKRTIFLSINIESIFKYIKDGWYINNMPYTIIKKGNKIEKFTNFNCLICIEDLFNNKYEAIEDLAIVYKNYINSPENNYYPIHNNCLMEYITFKLKKNFTLTSFNCPYRFKIDFDNFKYLINYDYYKMKNNKVYII